MRIWIVIPVFNEAATIGAVARAARRHGPVLVVDDGSSDASAAVAGAAGAEVLRHSRRLGKGQALRTGLAAARQRGATHVVTLDGDGQHEPDDLPALCGAARLAPDAIIVGSRVGADGTADGVPAGRLNAIHVAGFFVNWASGLAVADTQSGFRIYPLAILDRLSVRRGGFVFETEVLLAAAARGVSVREVPITVIARAGRRSRFRPVGDGIAIGAYLAGQTLARWRIEARAACGQVAAVLSADRRRARHTAMLEAGAARGDSAAAWATASTAVAIDYASARLSLWWHHPRRRRATAATGASLTAPVLLGLAVVHALAGRFLPDLVTPLVRRVYAQDRLAAVAEPASPAAVADESESVATPGLS